MNQKGVRKILELMSEFVCIVRWQNIITDFLVNY